MGGVRVGVWLEGCCWGLGGYHTSPPPRSRRPDRGDRRVFGVKGFMVSVGEHGFGLGLGLGLGSAL